MTPERWRQITELFHAAREHDPSRRDAFVAKACREDPALRQEVEAMLAGHDHAGSFGETPPSAAESDGVPRSSMLPAGTRVGPYEIQSALGAGGMGEVYRARDTRLHRDVAIKVLPDRFAAEAARLHRFEVEARAIAALNHPHICQIHDIGAGYLVLEYIEGEPLRGPMSIDQALRLALQIVSALEAAHQRGILHRDLKPANILVTREGTAKLLDFGLAKLMDVEADVTRTQDGVVVGTAGYMSPEQAQGRSLDARSDVFSVGAVLYEMLSGRRAFDGTSTAEVLGAVLRDEPPPIATPPALERIVRRCLAKQPGQRFQTMSELRGALGQAATEVISKPADRQPSIAVLPFANMSPDKANEFFSDGLAEELINALANMPGLKVAGRTSSFFFRGKDLEFQEIGRRLNVEHVLEGSVRTAGNRMRVTAQLIATADGFHLWSERYDREVTDIFAMQDEITLAIARALQIKLSPEAAPPRSHTPNLRSYEAYLKAREQWFRPTMESLESVKDLLERAIELDPKFALPHTLLGGYYTMQANLGGRPASEVIPLARAAEQAALRLDPSLPEAHALLGVCAATDYKWKEAEREWRLAFAREPVSSDVRFWYGNHYLMPIGRVGEAVEAEARVLEEDPLNALYRTLYAVALQHAGRLGDAAAELRTVLDLTENFPWAVGTLGGVCAQQGQLEEALVLTERAHTLMPWSNPMIGQLAALLVRTGARSRGEALTEELRSSKAYGAATGLAVFHALCGEFDRASEWIERAIEEGHPRLIALLKPLLPSSRWPDVARMMNLPTALA
jgi:eukaryotic-like serine/threonine-protein kinase